MTARRRRPGIAPRWTAAPGDEDPAPALTSPRAAWVPLAIVTAFILYGSLFPFQYDPRHYPGGPLAYLLTTWRQWDHRGDLLANILLYMPFGFFTACTLPRRMPGPVRILLAALIGASLAGAVETAQFHDLGRYTSMGDVYANGLGAALGGIAAVLVGTSLRWPLVGEMLRSPRCTLLITMFFAYRLYPYVPVIDLHKYWHAVRPMLTAPHLPAGETTRYFITWLFVAAIVDALYDARRVLLVLPLLCGLEFAGRILIQGTVLKLDDIVSAGAAFLLWALLLRRWPRKFAIIALLFGTMIAIERLQPFDFTPTPRAFGLVPFASVLQGSTGIDIQAFFQKFYQYGGLIWLLTRTGLRLPASTLLTALLLLATSLAECWLPLRSAQITDALMALLIGTAFAVLPDAATSPPATSAPSFASHHRLERHPN